MKTTPQGKERLFIFTCVPKEGTDPLHGKTTLNVLVRSDLNEAVADAMADPHMLEDGYELQDCFCYDMDEFPAKFDVWRRKESVRYSYQGNVEPLLEPTELT